MLTSEFQEQLRQGCSPEESDTFQAHGSEILDQMLQCLEHLPKPMPQLEVKHLPLSCTSALGRLFCLIRTTWTWWGCQPCFHVWRCSSFKAARWTCWRGRRWTVRFRRRSRKTCSTTYLRLKPVKDPYALLFYSHLLNLFGFQNHLSHVVITNCNRRVERRSSSSRPRTGRLTQRSLQADVSFADYFSHIAKVNQLLVLSQQLEEDVRHLGSHKYIAHQLSVIYQVVSSFRGVDIFSETKKDIEANFKQMKESLVQDEGFGHQPQLAARYIHWILDVTHELTSAVLSLPDELTDDLDQAVTFMSQFVTTAPPSGIHS
ncbi:uncharacterized protein si:ch211-218d20.15 isoform X3 [Phyllopteryx taeniolatus]|uniref:uncharacterized protein si:ch211-218d20.15 isoform X3 n=1 Tax=Phyllopteryx taeniolatus TaxID=161469 RepID=UPI002AD2EE1F|nr:uncharacterized protein si:ch211-218d20.15 isoform X3 [Phyllopteryx taeniolatus]